MAFSFFSSLRFRLIVLVLVSIMPLLALFIYTGIEHRKLALVQARRGALYLTHAIAKGQEQAIDAARQLMVGLAQLPQVRNQDSRSCSRLFAHLHQKLPLYTIVGAAKPNGDVFCSSLQLAEPINLADRSYFQAVLQARDLVIGGYQTGRISGRANIPIAYPSFDASGDLQAVIFVGIDIGWVDQILAYETLPSGASISLIDRNGTILYRRPDPEKWIGKSIAGTIELNGLLKDSEGSVEAMGLDGVRRFYVFSVVRGMPESKAPIVRVGLPRATVFSEVNRIARHKFAVLGLIALLALIAAGLFAELSLLRPVGALLKATARLGKGDLSARTGLPYTRGELGQLASAFDQMSSSLQTQDSVRRRAEEQARRQHERLEALHEIDLAITSHLDLQTVLNVLLEKIDLLLPYSACGVRIINPKTGKLEELVARNVDEKELQAAIEKTGRGLSERVLESRKPLIIRNVQSELTPPLADFFVQEGLVSYLGLPLISEGKIIGVLSLLTREEHEFGEEEVEFLTTLASQAAIAIHHSQLYEQTKRQAIDLERANKVKDEFLSVMSHELRTPLTVVMGYTGMVRDGMLGELNPKQDEALHKVLTRSGDLLALINGVLQATQLEAETVQVAMEVVSLKDLLDQLRSFYSAPLDKKITLIWDYPPDLPVIETDSTKLQHILRNLIHNAIKFTERGSVTVTVEVRGQGSGAGADTGHPTPSPRYVEFKVTDTGIGIPKEMHPTIFEKFRQLDSSETRLYGGIGLGLYIVKKLTELLGGTVQVESEPGKGSTFAVIIPEKPS